MPGENPGTEPAAFPHTAPVAARVAPPVVASAPLAPPAPVVAPPPVVAAAPVVTPQPLATPVTEMAAVATPYDEHCKAVARQRAADARANGYSFDMADTVYDGTYKDCVAWDSQHGPSVAR